MLFIRKIIFFQERSKRIKSLQPIAHPRSTYPRGSCPSPRVLVFRTLTHSAVSRTRFWAFFYLIQTTMQVSARLSSPCTLPGINGQNDESEFLYRFHLFEDAISRDSKFSPVTSSRTIYLRIDPIRFFVQDCFSLSLSLSLFLSLSPRVMRHVSARSRKKKEIGLCFLSETNCLYLQLLPRARKREKIQQAGVKCKRRETHVRRSARACTTSFETQSRRHNGV